MTQTSTDRDRLTEQLNKQSFRSGPLADPLERRAIFNVLDSFRQYRRQTHFSTTHRRRQNFYALPKSHQDLLNDARIDFLDILSTIDDAIDENADVANRILELALETFELQEQPPKGSPTDWHDRARPLDLNKAHSTIKQFYRDWSRQGFEAEVRPVLGLILEGLSKHLDQAPSDAQILLPGAGLGRLLFELCLAGYNAEGNEISYHQLLASHFILNTADRANQYRLFPFLNSFNNHTNRHNQLQCVTIPDVHPGEAMSTKIAAGETVGRMNMTAGDFITSYSAPDNAASFNAVVTVYFIDTAPNVMRYIETIHHCLESGGVWINVGPLLWHFEDRVLEQNDARGEDNDQSEQENEPLKAEEGIAEAGSLELTDEEVVALVQSMGFDLILHEALPPAHGDYIQDSTSMLRHVYYCSHWIVRKK